MKLLTLFLVIITLCPAQCPLICPTQSAPPPTNFLGVGSAWNPSARPQVSGWESYAHLISRSQQIYSYTTHEVTPLRHPLTLQTSIRTGLAFVIRKIGPFYVLGLGDAGAAASSESVTGSYSGGGVIIYQIGQTNWGIVGVSRVINGQPHPVYELGIGRSW